MLHLVTPHYPHDCSPSSPALAMRNTSATLQTAHGLRACQASTTGIHEHSTRLSATRAGVANGIPALVADTFPHRVACARVVHCLVLSCNGAASCDGV
jgi:hypothetical protein